MARGTLKRIHKVLSRKRVFDSEQLDTGSLRRCLNFWDLTALGLGSTLGVGVYVLVGSVALNVAGPSIVISFLIASVASLFAGLCYAEFGSRVPKAGSSFIYTYVAVGEFAAFIIGWNNILEAVFGTASVAKGLSLYVDSMVNKTMTGWFVSVVPINGAIFSSYFDFFAFAVVLVLGVVLAVGVRESSFVNNIFAALNMSVILFIIICGAFKADLNNWSIPASEVPPDYGVGGFFPYGVWGTLRGAAICFYGFVGFDSISSTGDEVRNPRCAIPRAILTVLMVALVAYTCVATVITMMLPYYLQDSVASLATAFSFVGWEWARWIVSCGAIFGIIASMFGAMFPLSRLLYAMSSDGLLLHWFSSVSTSRQSPIIATLVPATIISILAGVLELDQLVMMMCIGTLLSYTIVAVCVIKLRYNSKIVPAVHPGYWKQMVGCGERRPSEASSRIVSVALVLFVIICLAMALVVIHMTRPIVLSLVLHAVALVLLLIITLQPQEKGQITFKTPLVPLVPCLSIYGNIHLMILINFESWLRVMIWLLIGIPVYLLCLYFYKQKAVKTSIKKYHNQTNGKSPVQIIVEPATPPETMTRSQQEQTTSEGISKESNNITVVNDKLRDVKQIVEEEIILQHAVIEDNEEKEAKIIDLLDQVLQAEEASYSEIIFLEQKETPEEENQVEKPVETEPTSIPHRKSLSELSDAGSDASGIQILSKYDVIVQVHREDLPKVNEEEERKDNVDETVEKVFEHNLDSDNSETNSQTDESGYSDTLDITNKELAEDLKYKDEPYIPAPPPFDESYFATPLFKKSYTVPARPGKPKLEESQNAPRVSVTSNASLDDGSMAFGSDKQVTFMSKLNTIFQTKMSESNEPVKESLEEETKRRSKSTGNVLENTGFSVYDERPSIFLDLQKELLSKEATQILRPVNVEKPEKDEEKEGVSLSREDIKSKLENIFANGGPRLMKPRLTKPSQETPEESSTSDMSSNESITKPNKIDKNDTLKRQKVRFGAVLNSISRMSLNREEAF